MRNKKVIIAIISVVALLLVLIGVTYAYWLVTKTQTNSNIISSACLDITLDNERDDISLSSQYPMSDEEGMKLTPYTFTVTNNCNTSVDYQIALESIGDEAHAIKASALKVALDNNTKLYSAYSEVTSTINGSYESRSIGYAKLAAAGNEGSSVTHSVRIWIDENAPISEANKTFQSKISVTVGQGIDSPYETGTLAYDILVNNGGAGVSEIDATETADRITAVGNVSVGTSGNYYYGTTYTYDASTNKYVLGGEVVQAKLNECRDGTKSCGKYTTKSTAIMSATLYEITDFQASGHYVTAYTREYTTAFAGIGIDSSLNKTQDDLGDSYYFRGNVSNNYVQFGTRALKIYTISNMAECRYDLDDFCIYPSLESCQSGAGKDYYSVGEDISCLEMPTENAGKSMYWRVVRINGDGTIRLIYDGSEKIENGKSHIANIEEIAYDNGDYHHVDYKDSDIQYILDNWYNIHLKTNYEKYIADGIFCNDKDATELYYDYLDCDGEEPNEYCSEEEGRGTGYILYEERDYSGYLRLKNNVPTLKCTRPEDRYTKTTAYGNGLLTHPVGLLTADEAAFAGAGILWGLIFHIICTLGNHIGQLRHLHIMKAKLSLVVLIYFMLVRMEA